MSRALQKTCTYGIMHLSVAILVAFALTHNWRFALAVGIIEPAVQTFAFAIHERLWSRNGEVKALSLCGHSSPITAPGLAAPSSPPKGRPWPFSSSRASSARCSRSSS